MTINSTVSLTEEADDALFKIKKHLRDNKKPRYNLSEKVSEVIIKDAKRMKLI